MERMKINVRYFSKIKNAHTAANVNANDIWNYLIAKITCKAYYTSGTSMNVWHNTYLLVRKDIYG